MGEQGYLRSFIDHRLAQFSNVSVLETHVCAYVEALSFCSHELVSLWVARGAPLMWSRVVRWQDVSVSEGA